jgi:hypothetical protein
MTLRATLVAASTYGGWLLVVSGLVLIGVGGYGLLLMSMACLLYIQKMPNRSLLTALAASAVGILVGVAMCSCGGRLMRPASTARNVLAACVAMLTVTLAILGLVAQIRS